MALGTESPNGERLPRERGSLLLLPSPDRPYPKGVSLPGRVLQIATFADDPEALQVGIRNFPVHKLDVICYERDRARAESHAPSIRSVLGIPVSIHTVKEQDLLAVIETIGKILHAEQGNFDEVLLNVGGGDKHLTCSATSAAFVHGLKAFHVIGDTPLLLPIVKMSYTQLVSPPKMEILKAIQKASGKVESLEQLSQLSNYGKPLLSYHIQGAEDARGLAELGLVEVERGKRGRSVVRLTPVGRMLLLTS